MWQGGRVSGMRWRLRYPVESPNGSSNSGWQVLGMRAPQVIGPVIMVRTVVKVPFDELQPVTGVIQDLRPRLDSNTHAICSLYVAEWEAGLFASVLSKFFETISNKPEVPSDVRLVPATMR